MRSAWPRGVRDGVRHRDAMPQQAVRASLGGIGLDEVAVASVLELVPVGTQLTGGHQPPDASGLDVRGQDQARRRAGGRE